MTAYRCDTIALVKKAWPKASKWLEKANAYSRENKDLLDVYAAVRNDPFVQLWMSDTAAVVTQTVQEKDGWVLHFWLAGGEMEGVQEIYSMAETMARGLGCRRMSLRGRPGWVRSFLSRGEGWRPAHSVEMEKDL